MSIYLEGMKILVQRRILQEPVDVSTKRWYFKVAGTNNQYEVLIGENGKTSCTCAHGSLYANFLCKHIVAGILLLSGTGMNV